MLTAYTRVRSPTDNGAFCFCGLSRNRTVLCALLQSPSRQNGIRERNRTPNLGVWSALLYQLSYADKKLVRDGKLSLNPCLAENFLVQRAHTGSICSAFPASCGQAAHSQFPLFLVGRKQGTDHGYPVTHNCTISHLALSRTGW